MFLVGWLPGLEAVVGLAQLPVVEVSRCCGVPVVLVVSVSVVLVCCGVGVERGGGPLEHGAVEPVVVAPPGADMMLAAS